MSDTPTRNAQLAQLASLANDMLATYAGLPDIWSVKLQPDQPDQEPDSGEIDMQLRSRPSIPANLAAWARTLDTAVIFRMGHTSAYVEASIWTEVDGHRVRIWDHMTPLDVYKLLGLELGETPVLVEPDRLLELADRADDRAVTR